MTGLQLTQPGNPVPRLTPRLALRDVSGVAKRNLLRTIRTPQLLLLAAIEPMMLLIVFRYIFAGAIEVPGGSYADFVVPAIFLLAVLVGAVTFLIRSAVVLAITVGLGVAVGLRFHAGAASILPGMQLILAFGYSFSRTRRPANARR